MAPDLSPEDDERFNAIGNYWESSAPDTDGYADLGGGDPTGASLVDEVRFLLHVVDRLAAELDRRRLTAPTYRAEHTSTVYACGHHPYDVRCDDRPGYVSVACGYDDARRLVAWLNRQTPSTPSLPTSEENL